ncbi:MAG: HupE/UreJ family protein [Gemmatimonadetes bacterium]|nr:HupE/UreJ family protein [Gemmatimonadota bacterium]
MLLCLPAATAAHDIPSTVTVLAFVRPEGRELRLVLRVPLAAMRDFNFPLRGAGYLDIERSDSLIRDAARTWLVSYLELYENGVSLRGVSLAAARISLPSDRSFLSYDSALAHVLDPALPRGTEIVWQQAMLDVLFEYPIQAAGSRFSIHPALSHLGLRTTTVLRFLPPGGAERAFEYVGDAGLIQLDPRWHQAVLRFVQLGFLHILDGIDHLLFIICLVVPLRRLRPLIAVVTSFTVAHSITLIASVAGLAPRALWFPPFIEAMIALSIVYMALENIVGARLERRWLIAFGFGLVHGFGFSFVLRESLQFAGSHLATSLVSFNLGVELGQVFVLALGVPALALLYRHVVAERVGVIIVSVLVAHTAWHWMIDRAAALRQYEFRWPALDLALLGGAMRGAMLVLILAGALWALYGLYGKLLGRTPEQEPNA